MIDYGKPYSVAVSQAPAQPTRSLVGATAGVVAGTVNGPIDVVYDCPHFGYVTNEGDGTLSTYNVVDATGGLAVSTANPFGTIASPYLIITSSNQSFAYVTSLAGGINAYGLDATVGTLSANNSNPFASGIASYGLAFDLTAATPYNPTTLAKAFQFLP